ncbi:response regulator [Aurantivibrio infirmus]
MGAALKLIFVDEDPGDLELATRITMEVVPDCDVLTLQSTEQLKNTLKPHLPYIIFIDYCLSGNVGTEVIKDLSAFYPCASFVLLTRHSDEELVISALRAGAVDFLKKDELNTQSLNSLLTRIASNKGNRLFTGVEKYNLAWY